MSDAYKVGYGKPPKSTQFKKGRSGNPKGRPKKQVSLTSAIHKAAMKKVSVKTAAGTKKTSVLEVIIERLFNDAAKGDAPSRKVALKLLQDIDLHAELKSRSETTVQNLDEADLAVLARLQANTDNDD